jgi:hypothetical protein
VPPTKKPRSNQSKAAPSGRAGAARGRRPAPVPPIEVYTSERKAQFLLSNAIDADDYAGAVAEVRRMGLDPEAIPHYKPPGA